ncbi:MAG: glycine--tRNA ligase subunit beta [Gammaproteobacteria bacterium]
MSTSNTTSFDDLLLEIGTEELPPRSLMNLAQAFASGITSGLDSAGLQHGELQIYATPRRLALIVPQLAATQSDREVIRRGPAVAAAFGKDGKPTSAAVGFAQSCGLSVEQLERTKTDKGEWLSARIQERGKAVNQLLPAMVNVALDKLPIPKRMRWGSGKAEFVRPVHWVVMLYGNAIVDADVLGVRSNRYTRGHRFHHPAPIEIAHPREYAHALQSRGFVIADFALRRETIRQQVATEAAQEKSRVHMDAALLDEVTALTEWPMAIVGGFDARFLALPAEVLIATMQEHQRYFPLWDNNGHLLPRFITIANIESKQPDAVRLGNERVIRPRLTDAEFFWNQDRAKPLAARQEELKSVVFQKELGTLHDKTQRVTMLAAEIATLIGGDVALAERAAKLSRCDLLTNMVGEFPELQGLMGRYYATHDGEPEEVAHAIEEMYRPRQAGGDLPQTRTGQALAIAERLDTLVGIFGIGQPPTGEKDPYALRRAALGVLRTIIEQRLDLDLHSLLKLAVSQYGTKFDNEKLVSDVYYFLIDRLRGYYADQNVRADVFEAVQATEPTRPLDMAARLRAVSAFGHLPAAASLAAANKRIANILKKTDVALPEKVDSSALVEPAEKALYAELRRTIEVATPLLADRDYADAMSVMAGLRETVDAFFDSVMVMSEDVKLRDNRLALLNQMRTLFLKVADISRLQG